MVLHLCDQCAQGPVGLSDLKIQESWIWQLVISIVAAFRDACHSMRAYHQQSHHLVVISSQIEHPPCLIIPLLDPLALEEHCQAPGWVKIFLIRHSCWSHHHYHLLHPPYQQAYQTDHHSEWLQSQAVHWMVCQSCHLTHLQLQLCHHWEWLHHYQGSNIWDLHDDIMKCWCIP